MVTSREDKILVGLTKASRILEIGASYSPLVPKRDGWTSWTVDHATRAGLVEKFAGDPAVDVTKIEEVDFVWAGGALDAAIPAELHGSFDACVSSHVIEHIPDFAGFFISLSRLLAPSGIVAMAIPDKRFCFDYFLPHATTGRILAAHRAGAERHAFATLFDHIAYACSNDGTNVWGQSAVGDIRLLHPTLATAGGLLPAPPSDVYTDCHAWQFTPSCFALIVLELRALGVIDFHVARAFPTAGCEFHVQLAKGAGDGETGDALEARRRALLERIVEELGEQADYLRARPGMERSLAGAVRRQVSAYARRLAQRLLRPRK